MVDSGLALSWICPACDSSGALIRTLSTDLACKNYSVVPVFSNCCLAAQELEAMTPSIQPKFSSALIPPILPAKGQKKYRVALLTGCAQDLMFSDVNRDTAEVLARNGCEVVTPARQSCCGSLHAHNGELELARQLARKSIDQFPPEQFDAIISNAAGCGSHLKHYASLLADDPAYVKRAQLWDAKLKGHPRMAGAHWPRRRPNRAHCPAQSVTYHEACHLCHGQKITAQPRQLLRAIPNLTLTELPKAIGAAAARGFTI
jgi:glycolate oxidase iron-sulfur subunit